MKLLIDSSTNYLYLALMNEVVIDCQIRNGKNDHSETLIDVLTKFLEKNKTTPEMIDEIYVGKGPGSYTGVRISGTIAKVFAMIKNIKLFSFSTLDLFLCSKIKTDGLYLMRIVAKKNHSYYKKAKINNSKIELMTEDSFGEDEVLNNFKDCFIIEVNDDLFIDPNLLAQSIIDNKLFTKEDYYTYVPNYLRSEING